MTYGQAPLYSQIWITLIWYAMSKYRFLGIYERSLYFDALDSIHEFVILINGERNVVWVNRALRERMSIKTAIPSLEQLFFEHELIRRQMDTLSNKTELEFTLNILSDDEKLLPTTAHLTIFWDRFQDFAGYILSAKQLPERYSELKKRGITEREYQMILLIYVSNNNKKIAAGLNISLRTVETHITNNFFKLNVKNRSELINLCSTTCFPISLRSTCEALTP